MELMQLIKDVLDEIYPAIQGPTDADRDNRIEQSISTLNSAYTELLSPSRVPIDYSLPECRFAYIYKYTTAHADYINQLIQCSPNLQALIKNHTIDVACIGGGPGSDFLGILKYMMLTGASATVTCYIYDREDTWGEAWGEIAKKIGPNFRVFPVFQQVDVTDPASYQNKTKFLSADLFTFSYFLSELYSIRSSAQLFFDQLFTSAKSNSVFLFVDNNDGNGLFAGWFDEMAARHGFIVDDSQERELAFGNDEEKTHLSPYYPRFNWPKRKSNLCLRVCRKP